MSLKIGRFFGINLFVHWSFWLLPLWVIWTHAAGPDSQPLALQLALLGALFGCVVLHEYGHALTARLFGIATRDVTLYPIGGVASLERMSERPFEELCIAIAGPLVNLAIAVSLGGGLLVAGVVSPGMLNGLMGEFAVLLLIMNISLFAFNLLPAFPMDGGRVLRALLAMPFGRLRATRISVVISIALVAFFALLAMLPPFTPLLAPLHNPWLVMIGAFVILAGMQELAVIERGHGMQHGEHVSPHGEMPDHVESPSGGVTVYVWDGRRHAWIPQGVVPAHPFQNGHARPVG